MLVDTQPTTIQHGGEARKTKQVQASIVASAINFRAVTAYQHPIHALLRELGQNAADSHVLAGKSDVPFEVSMPSDLSPQLTVRDFGTGMDPEEFQDNVINVGDSSKRGADGQTGGFGRGLYAILGYTDMFTMRCWKDGVEYSHACYYDESGLPTWDIDENGKPSDESSGVEVKVPVQTKDIGEFRRESINVYRWFGHPLSQYKCLPILKGVSIEPVATKLVGDDYLVAPEEMSAVVMGNVRYPIAMSQQLRDGLSETARDLVREGVIIYMPLAVERDGEQIQPVTPAPQRDGMIYNEKTIKSISLSVERISDRILKDAQAAVVAADTQIEARRRFEEVFGTSRKRNFAGKVLTARKAKVLYEGRDLSVPMFANRHVVRKEKDAFGQEVEKTIVVPLVKLESWTNPHHNRVSSMQVPILPHSATRILVRDIDKGYKTRMRHYVLNNGPAHVLTAVDSGDLKKWIRKYGLQGIVQRVSELPEPPKVERKRYASKKTVKELTFNFERHSSDAWEDAEIDLNEGGVYVEVFRYSWRSRGEEDYRHLSELRRYKKILGDIRLIGLRKGPVEKLAKDKELAKKWLPLEQFVTKRLRDIVKGKKFSMQLSALESAKSVLINPWLRGQDFGRDSLFGKAAKAAKSIASMSDEDCAAGILYNHARIDFKDRMPEGRDVKVPLLGMLDDIRKKYPLLYMIPTYSRSQATSDAMAEYIRAIDSQK